MRPSLTTSGCFGWTCCCDAVVPKIKPLLNEEIKDPIALILPNIEDLA